MNKIKKITFVFIICYIIFIIISNNVQALSLNEIFSKSDDFLNVEKSPIDLSSINTLIGSLFSIGVGMGILIAVIITSVLGVKFILASPTEKAEIKETLIPLFIGTIVMAGSYGIWKLAVNLINIF